MAKSAKEERSLSDKEAVAIQLDEETKKLILDDKVRGQYVIVRTSLSQKEQSSSKDLVGVSRNVIEHKLVIYGEAKPKKQ